LEYEAIRILRGVGPLRPAGKPGEDWAQMRPAYPLGETGESLFDWVIVVRSPVHA
jgi:hypothetical protein